MKDPELASFAVYLGATDFHEFQKSIVDFYYAKKAFQSATSSFVQDQFRSKSP